MKGLKFFDTEIAGLQLHVGYSYEKGCAPSEYGPGEPDDITLERVKIVDRRDNEFVDISAGLKTLMVDIPGKSPEYLADLIRDAALADLKGKSE